MVCGFSFCACVCCVLDLAVRRRLSVFRFVGVRSGFFFGRVAVVFGEDDNVVCVVWRRFMV